MKLRDNFLPMHWFLGDGAIATDGEIVELLRIRETQRGETALVDEVEVLVSRRQQNVVTVFLIFFLEKNFSEFSIFHRKKFYKKLLEFPKKFKICNIISENFEIGKTCVENDTDG